MGFEILPVEPGDEDKYEVITITSPTKWAPHAFVKLNNDDLDTYNPSENDSTLEVSDYPAALNHLNHVDQDSGETSGEEEIKILDESIPILDTQICATATWHRAITKEIDPQLLRPYLGYRPLIVIKKTLQKTTQMAKMTIRHPMR